MVTPVYFDNAREYASATQNIKVLDSLNASVLKAQYVELFKAKDSMRATGEAIVAVNWIATHSMCMEPIFL